MLWREGWSETQVRARSIHMLRLTAGWKIARHEASPMGHVVVIMGTALVVR